MFLDTAKAAGRIAARAVTRHHLRAPKHPRRALNDVGSGIIERANVADRSATKGCVRRTACGKLVDFLPDAVVLFLDHIAQLAQDFVCFLTLRRSTLLFDERVRRSNYRSGYVMDGIGIDHNGPLLPWRWCLDAPACSRCRRDVLGMTGLLSNKARPGAGRRWIAESAPAYVTGR